MVKLLKFDRSTVFHCHFKAIANYSSWAAHGKATHLKAILQEHQLLEIVIYVYVIKFTIPKIASNKSCRF
jgi:hypothetical protein